MTLTLDQLKEHVETDLVDDALQRLLDDAYATLASRVGVTDSGSLTESLRAFSEDQFVFLSQPVDSADDIDSITVRVLAPEAPMEDLELETTDWRLLDHRSIQRLEGADAEIVTPTWWGFRTVGWPGAELEVLVTYTPSSATEGSNLSVRTDRVAIDLVKLAIAYNALKSESAGDYSSSSLEYQKERESLIRELVPKVGFA